MSGGMFKKEVVLVGLGTMKEINKHRSNIVIGGLCEDAGRSDSALVLHFLRRFFDIPAHIMLTMRLGRITGQNTARELLGFLYVLLQNKRLPLCYLLPGIYGKQTMTMLP